jgi:hypothetical protein
MYELTFSTDIPARSASKKHDEESVTSSKRDDSPILKKAAVSLRSELRQSFVFYRLNVIDRAISGQ